MWKSQTSTSGFKVTYSPFIPDSSGWLEVNYMFGETDLTSDHGSLEFDPNSQLSSFEICVDNHSQTELNEDFKGFKFNFADSDTQTLSAQCDGLYTDFDLTEKTLVGFRTIISDFDSGDRRNIKTICPIVQELDCTTTNIRAELDPFEHEIASGVHNHDI